MIGISELAIDDEGVEDSDLDTKRSMLATDSFPRVWWLIGYLKMPRDWINVDKHPHQVVNLHGLR
jgi:hypothetical protein